MVSDRGTVNTLGQRIGYGKLYKAGDKKAVLAIPGWLSTRDFLFDSSANVPTEVLQSLASYGFAFGSWDTLATWGNAVSRTNMTQLMANMQAALTLGGKVHLFGVSMGGVICLNWAKNNPTLVQSICLVIPTVDIQAIYDGNRQGAQADISTAYGGLRPADADNPAKNAASFLGLPLRIYYSGTDPYTLSDETAAFAQGSGAELQLMGNIGHALAAPFSGEALGAFVKAHD